MKNPGRGDAGKGSVSDVRVGRIRAEKPALTRFFAVPVAMVPPPAEFILRTSAIGHNLNGVNGNAATASLSHADPHQRDRDHAASYSTPAPRAGDSWG